MARQHFAQAGGFMRWRWSIALIAFALAALFLSGAGASAPGNVHGSVFAWAHQNPGEPVPVIVQTTGNTDSVVSAVQSAGGTVGRQFQIISAVEGRVPASEVASLASNDAVSWVSLNAPVVSTDDNDHNSATAATTANLVGNYPFSVDAPRAWNRGIDGTGVGVAVVDTGVSPTDHADFLNAAGASRVVASVAVNSTTSSLTDGYGHGSHIAGTIGGDGSLLNGKYVGVAPDVNLIGVKIADDSGSATLADLIAGLEWVYNNRVTYNIRVVNLSLHSSVVQSYKQDPLDAAVEFLWFNNIFVVVAAGNDGATAGAVDHAPANDPFIMTVGAIDDMNTKDFSDDVVTDWSSRGVTMDGFSKPELFTPGRNIVSFTDTNSILFQTYPDKVVDGSYFRLSGTSMAAGVMSGAAALYIDAHSNQSSGRVKCALISTARGLTASASQLVPRVMSAIGSESSCNSNTGIARSTALAPLMKVAAVAAVLSAVNPSYEANRIKLSPLDALGAPGTTIDNVDWTSIKWDSIKWDSIKWDSIKWDSIKWDSVKWDSVTPDGVDFTAIKWDSIKWDSIKWSAIKWDSIKWDSIKWDSVKWDFLPDGS